MGVKDLHKRAAELKQREQMAKQGLRTRKTASRIAWAHHDYVERMRRVGDMRCVHPSFREESDGGVSHPLR